MTVLAKTPLVSIDKLHNFGVKDQVHHTIYFRQPQTVEFIGDCLGIK